MAVTKPRRTPIPKDAWTSDVFVTGAFRNNHPYEGSCDTDNMTKREDNRKMCLPIRTGCLWNSVEENALLHLWRTYSRHDDRIFINDLARFFQRTTGAIEARLENMGVCL